MDVSDDVLDAADVDVDVDVDADVDVDMDVDVDVAVGVAVLAADVCDVTDVDITTEKEERRRVYIGVRVRGYTSACARAWTSKHVISRMMHVNAHIIQT